MNITTLLAIPVWIAGLVTFALDYYITCMGIKQGVAEEGNPIVRYFYGGKPNPLQLMAALLPQDVAALTAATLLIIFMPNPGLGLGVAGANVARHIYEIYQWEKLGVKRD